MRGMKLRQRISSGRGSEFLSARIAYKVRHPARQGGRAMIDNARQTVRLIGKLKSSLPVPAVMTPDCLAKFHKETGEAGLSPLCMVTQIHYLGDEGGIICGL